MGKSNFEYLKCYNVTDSNHKWTVSSELVNLYKWYIENKFHSLKYVIVSNSQNIYYVRDSKKTNTNSSCTGVYSTQSTIHIHRDNNITEKIVNKLSKNWAAWTVHYLHHSRDSEGRMREELFKCQLSFH